MKGVVGMAMQSNGWSRREILRALSMAPLAGLSSGLQAEGDSLLTLGGGKVSLRDLRGRFVLLSFGGVRVPLIARELAALQRIADRYAAREVEVCWVSIDSDRPGARNYASNDDLRAFMQRSNLQLRVLRDPAMATYHAFQIEAVPTTLLLDRDGRIVRRFVGIGTEPGELYGEIVESLEKLVKS